MTSNVNSDIRSQPSTTNQILVPDSKCPSRRILNSDVNVMNAATLTNYLKEKKLQQELARQFKIYIHDMLFVVFDVNQLKRDKRNTTL